MSFKATIEADIKGFTNNIDKAIGSVDKLEKTTLQKLSKVGNSFISIGKKASILSVAVAAAGAKAFSMASDFEDALGATDQVFKESSEAIKDWANNLGSQYGVAKREALEYANLMGTMLKNIGQLTEDQASKQSQALVELAGDLTAMFGGSTQEAVNALTSSLRGNNIALTRYGVAINDALIKQKALELGLVSGTSEMSLQAKQAATLALIWDQTGASQGQAAREADSASGAMRAFRTEVANLSTELGEVLLPIITPVISKLTDLVGSLRALSPEMQSVIVGIAGVTAVAGPLLVVIGKILKALPLIKAGFVALTGPIGLVSGAIILLVANFEDAVRNVTTMWNTFTTGISSSVKALVSLVTLDFKGFWTNTKAMVGNGVKYVVGQMEFMGGKIEWVLRKLGLEEWANRINAAFGGINIDQAALEVALAANEMTGSMGANKKAVEETIQPTIDLAKANDDLAKSQEKVVENLKAMRLVIPQKEGYSLFNELFTQSGNELILNPTIEPTIDSASLKSKMYESVKSAMGDLSEGIKVMTIDITSMVTDIIDSAFSGIADAIANKENVVASLGASLLAPLGNILSQLGKMLITTGAGFEALQKMFANPFGGGLGAIAVGVALMALGAAAKAGASAIMANQNKSSGYSSAPSLRNTSPGYAPSEYRGAYQDDFVVEFRIGNDELIGTLDTAQQRRNRL